MSIGNPRLSALNKFGCRLYQLCMRAASYLMPWRKPEIIDGNNALDDLVQRIGALSIDRVLIVTDPTIFRLGLIERLTQRLNSTGIEYHIYKDTQQNPTLSNVEEARRAYLDNDCQAIIAFGGGSPMDCAKAAGARIARPKKPVNKMGGLLKVRKRLPPFFAIPTTAGTGSEATLAAVISDPDARRKFAINDINLIPHYAVLEPSLTIGLPPNITAYTGMDALTHAIEAYIGKSNTSTTRSDALTAVRLIHKNLLPAFKDGGSLAERANMLLASHYAGRAFTRAYVGNVHAAAHTLSAYYGVQHGLANAVLLPRVLEYYGSKVFDRLARIADAMQLGDGESNAVKSKLLIDYIDNLNAEMGIPQLLDVIQDEDLPHMIDHALREANPLYPVPVIFGYSDFDAVFRSIRPSTAARHDRFEFPSQPQ